MHGPQTSVANEPVRLVNDHFSTSFWRTDASPSCQQPTMHHHQHKPLGSCQLFTNALDTRIFASACGKSNGEALAESVAACVFKLLNSCVIRLRNMSPAQTAQWRVADHLKGWSPTAMHSATVEGKTLFNRLVEDIVAKQEKRFKGTWRRATLQAFEALLWEPREEFSSSQAPSVEVEMLDDILLRAVTAFMQQNSSKSSLTAWLSVAGRATRVS